MATPGLNLGPHTQGRPLQLINVAGKPFLDHILATFNSLPQTLPREFIFILGAHSREIRSFIQESHPTLKHQFAEQSDPMGTAHSLYQARELLEGPVLFPLRTA